MESHNIIPVIDSLLGDFKRLHEVYPKAVLWNSENPVMIQDIQQGFTVGNCYMIAAFTAMAQK